MERVIEVGSYAPATGVVLAWADGFELTVSVSGNEVLVRGNAAGLLSLAQHLATLAGQEVPAGTHVHLDEYNSLEEGSAQLILERADG